ncbi:MAG: hypothetical protein AAGE65_04410 [Planctomycetota bacterium]
MYWSADQPGLDNLESTDSYVFATSASSDRFDMAGGRVGFSADTGAIGIRWATVWVDHNNDTNGFNHDGDFDDDHEVQINETFAVDGDGYPQWGGFESYPQASLVYDAAGNLICDGSFAYRYDAWNRLVEVSAGYTDNADIFGTPFPVDGDGDGSNADPERGAVLATYAYDGLGRRVKREIQNSGDADGIYHDYYSDRWQLLEVRNGSDYVLKQHVWGLDYIDELIQVAVNQDVLQDTDEHFCERVYFALQDAHYNVIGLTTATGHLVERYEYTPRPSRIYMRVEGAQLIPELIPITIRLHWMYTADLRAGDRRFPGTLFGYCSRT